jgi:alginate O-acetyltransferase complex protein AlgI
MIQHLDWWLFAALLPIAYWLAPPKWRAPTLAGASLVALLRLAPVDVSAMLGISVLAYTALAFSAAATQRGGAGALLARLVASPLPVLAVLGYLFWSKYAAGIARVFDHQSSIADIAVPLGISYWSFKLIHYIIERRRGTLPAHGFADYFSWLFLWPTFTAGPIERFDHYMPGREETFRIAYLVEGGTRIAQGLVKKFVLVEALVALSARISGGDIVAFAQGEGGMSGAGAAWLWLGLALLTLYLDFSAYSDLAIGASRLFGLRIAENFNYPLLATDIFDYWRRWHMTLAGWCRAYIYMPMIGLTRNPYLAVIATFVVMGAWHAGSAHWLAWGLWHGLGQAGALYWTRWAQRRKIGFFKTRPGNFVGWALTLAFVSLGGAFTALHRRGDLGDSWALIGRALGL